MCGIYGIITSSNSGLFPNEKKIFIDMMMASAVRGIDGAGIYYIPNEQKATTKIFKKSNNYFHLLYTKGFDKYWDSADKEARAIVGHNRAATKGSNDDVHTHPFKHEHITLVHNGTIHNGLGATKDDNDSQLLCKALAEKGVEIFKEITGAYACVWHDARDSMLYIARNHERPLAMIRTNTEIYFASEEKMLEWIMDRNSPTYNKQQEKIKIAVDTLYKIDLTNLGITSSDLPKKTYPPAITTSATYGGVDGGKYYKYQTNYDYQKQKETKESKEEIDVEFILTEKVILKHSKKFSVYEYYGNTVDGSEPVILRTASNLPMKDRIYFGKSNQTEDKVIAGQKTAFIKIRNRDFFEITEDYKDCNPLDEPTVKLVDGTNMEIYDAVDAAAAGCVVCTQPIKTQDIKSCIKSESTKGRLVCPDCSKHYTSRTLQ